MPDVGVVAGDITHTGRRLMAGKGRGPRRKPDPEKRSKLKGQKRGLRRRLKAAE